MWKNVGDGFMYVRLVSGCDLADIAKGTWTSVTSHQISRSASGFWSVNPQANGWDQCPSDEVYVPVLHDRDGGWRLTIPHGFEPIVSDGHARSWLAMSRVY